MTFSQKVVRKASPAWRRSSSPAGAAGGAVAGLSVLGALGCATGAAGSQVSGKLKIPLANSFIGNTWRLEMENTYRAAIAMEPYRSQVFGQVYNSSNDLSAQAQQISNLISAGVDAILIDSASPTGLNGVVSRRSGAGSSSCPSTTS